MMIVQSVVLRKPEPEDVGPLYDYRNDPLVTRSLVGFSTGYSKEALSNWVEQQGSRPNDLVYAIADAESNRCLGHAGLYNIDPRVRIAEFGILIGDKNHWGRGLGSAISRALVRYGFRELNLHRIYLKVLSTNERAISVYRRLGFQQEGVLRDEQFRDGRYVDVIVMGLLENEMDFDDE